MTQAVTALGLVRKGGMSLLVCAYLTALTFFDPARRRSSAGKAKTRRDADRGQHRQRRDAQLNARVGASRGFQVGAFVAQSLFLIFVLTTARFARPRRRYPGVFARTMTTGFPTAAREPWGRARLSLKSMLCQVAMPCWGERTLCG
jgi:hypothetical protein